MQAFSKSSLQKSLTMPPLTAQGIETGRDQMPFLAFVGTEKPRNYVSEYQRGSTTERFDVADAWGPKSKGEYEFRYGLIWDGEREIYDKGDKEFKKQGMYMTLSPSSSNATESLTGSKIIKEGTVKCTPGYVLENGECVLKTTVGMCQPGWRKVNGECVKDPREFNQGQLPVGPMGTAPEATEFPMSEPSILSLGRLRAYMQEKESGTKAGINWSGALPVIVIILAILAVLYMSRSK